MQNTTNLPSIGFGTYPIPEGEAIINATTWAIETGFRLIDTANSYDNEVGIGIAIKNCIENGIVTRDELFVTSKVPDWKQGYDSTIKCCKESLKKSGLDYFDLYLIHSPYRQNENWQKSVIDTYRALETLYREGLVKRIGVSNFGLKHLEFLLSEAEIKPEFNQLELHPQHQQREVVKYCQEHNIGLIGWGTLNQGRIYKNHIIQELAAKYGVTPADIAIKWSLQKGYIPLVGSKNKKHIEENYHSYVITMVISAADITLLDSLDGGEFSNGHHEGIKPIKMVPENSIIKEYNPATYTRIYKLFNLLPVLKEKKLHWNKTKWFIFGIPVLKIIKKDY